MPRSKRIDQIRENHGPEIARRYVNGETLKDLADEFGVGKDTIRRTTRENGVPPDPTRGRYATTFGPDHPHWKGGNRINARGYREVWVAPDDPMTSMRHTGSNYVYEHRLVMARHLNRPLLSNESVHHIDGDKLNNRIDNLQLRTAFHGPGGKFLCHDCGSHNVRAVPLD